MEKCDVCNSTKNIQDYKQFMICLKCEKQLFGGD